MLYPLLRSKASGLLGSLHTKLLEFKGITKGKNPTNVEAAILSFRNLIAKEIINEIKEEKENIEQLLTTGLFTSTKNNNIIGGKLLIEEGANINARDINYLKIQYSF